MNLKVNSKYAPKKPCFKAFLYTAYMSFLKIDEMRGAQGKLPEAYLIIR